MTDAPDRNGPPRDRGPETWTREQGVMTRDNVRAVLGDMLAEAGITPADYLPLEDGKRSRGWNRKQRIITGRRYSFEPGAGTSEARYTLWGVIGIGLLILVMVAADVAGWTLSPRTMETIDWAMTAIASLIGVYGLGRSIRKKGEGEK